MYDPDREPEAVDLCAGCPVRLPCAALGLEEPWGVWGGVTPEQRGFPRPSRDRRTQQDSEATVALRLELASLYTLRWGLSQRIATLEDRLADMIATGPRGRVRVVVCGTESGYTRHRQENTAPCRPCRDAKAAAERGRTRHKKGAA